MSFDYGQRHRVELAAARQIAEEQGAVQHTVVVVDLRVFGGSALTDDIPVPKDHATDAAGVPITYVPARNTIFLSFAVAWAEVLGADHIFIGVNVLDYSGYPDCRPEFVAAYEEMANLATKATTEDARRLRIRAPLMHMTKGEIIRLGTELGVDYATTISCYDPTLDGASCGHCASCQLRAGGFQEAGVADPTRYAISVS
jgi:7-cyano-7-deazaguanine synthase